MEESVKQANRYKEEALYWQKKYQNLKKEYQQLLYYVQDNKHFNSKCKRTAPDQTEQRSFLNEKTRIRREQSLNLVYEEEQENLRKSGQSSPIAQFNFQLKPTLTVDSNNNQLPIKQLQRGFFKTPKTPQNQQDLSPNRSPRNEELFDENDKQIDFFSVEQIQNSTEQQQQQIIDTNQVEQEQQKRKSRGLSLMQGYFILQKIQKFKQNIKNTDLWIKGANQILKQKQTNLLQIIYRYTFRQDILLNPLEDDSFDSRVNQIKYGTPYEDLIYSFDNFNIQGSSEEQESKLIKKSMRKKFIHCLIRPQIVYINGKPYQTQILYAFVSPFPFKTFFQDLHRTIQQQIKFELIKSQKDVQEQMELSKDKRIDIISQLMKNLFAYCQKNYSGIENYPITANISTNVSTLTLNVESQEDLKKMERENLQTLVRKYSLVKISKLVHYVLSEKQLIVVGTTRKNLNQIQEIIRLMIKPFYWVFSIVYRYSSHFEPFLSSPMPLIIGVIYDFNNYSYKENKMLMGAEFITIFVEQISQKQKKEFSFFGQKKPKHIPNDLRQISGYERDIQVLSKYLSKISKNSHSNTAERIAKYVMRLKNFIITGKIECELSNFLIDFMDTQLVQYFKDVLMGSSKKLSQTQEYNQEFAMTK